MKGQEEGGEPDSPCQQRRIRRRPFAAFRVVPPAACRDAPPPIRIMSCGQVDMSTCLDIKTCSLDSAPHVAVERMAPIRPFRGPWIIAGCFLTFGVASGFPYYNIAFFFDYFRNDHGWTQQIITFGAPLAVLPVSYTHLTLPTTSRV